jgi:hypothetical protein
MYDPSAVRYSCQVREIIREVTNETTFLRKGDFWYRNPEFGREVSDPAKRGRKGASFPKERKVPIRNPYTYQRYQSP